LQTESAVDIEGNFEAALKVAGLQGIQVSREQLKSMLDAFQNFGAAHDKFLDLNSRYASLLAIRLGIEDVRKEAAELPAQEDDWQYKLLFDHLFDGDDCAADRIHAILKSMDRKLVDYYDPDTTYREDAEAYIRAIDETIECIRMEIAGELEPENLWSR
jgi:hypothetical protein